jgi:integrase
LRGDILSSASICAIARPRPTLAPVTSATLPASLISMVFPLFATPRKADLAWTVLARILSFAKDRGIITSNPCERGGRLYVADRRDKIWTEQNIAAVLSVGSPEIQLALVLALWSGQRQGDLLRLPWSAYENPYIRLRQSKGGRRVAIPAGGPLRALLDTTEVGDPLS